MKTAIPRFLRYLRVERNASELTIKSYGEDFEALVEYLTEAFGHEPTPGEITPHDLRGYVGALHEAGYAKASVSRRLASLRVSFALRNAKNSSTTTPPNRFAIRGATARCLISCRPTKSANCWMRRQPTIRWGSAIARSSRPCTRQACA